MFDVNVMKGCLGIARIAETKSIANIFLETSIDRYFFYPKIICILSEKLSDVDFLAITRLTRYTRTTLIVKASSIYCSSVSPCNPSLNIVCIIEREFMSYGLSIVGNKSLTIRNNYKRIFFEKTYILELIKNNSPSIM